MIRLQKVGAKKRNLELRSLLRTVVPISRHVESVEGGSGAHEHMGVQNSGRHAFAETVAFAGMVRCAESCWRSHPYMQQHGKRRGSQLRLGADFVAKVLSLQKIDRLGVTMSKLACKCVGGKDVRHRAGLLHRCQ